jgi:hypothetical protein
LCLARFFLMLFPTFSATTQHGRDQRQIINGGGCAWAEHCVGRTLSRLPKFLSDKWKTLPSASKPSVSFLGPFAKCSRVVLATMHPHLPLHQNACPLANKDPKNWPSFSHELTSCTSLVQWPEYYSVHVGCILSARPHFTFFCLVPTLCGRDLFRDSSCNNTAARFLIFISIPL